MSSKSSTTVSKGVKRRFEKESATIFSSKLQEEELDEDYEDEELDDSDDDDDDVQEPMIIG